MGSTRAVDARPVRRPPSSCLSDATAPCILRLSSLMSCVGLAMAGPSKSSARNRIVLIMATSRIYSKRCFLRIYDRGATFAANHGLDGSLLPDREHNDRHPIFPGKRECGCVQDFEIALNRLLMGQAIITNGIRVFLGIGTVDAIDV